MKSFTFVHGALFCANFFAFFCSTQSIRCYQCDGSNSTNPFQCNEWLNSDIDIIPESCDGVFDAKYCVKHIGRYEAASGIKCYQCSAAESLDCSDGMIHFGGLDPTECDSIFEAAYCIKSTGLDGGIGAKRFCSSLDLGNYCNYVKQPGDTLEYYRTCIFTCSGDGCNSSSMISAIPFIVLLYAFVSLFFKMHFL